MTYKTGSWGNQAKERQKERRLVVIGILGSKCAKCGFDDYRALQIDHINGNGNKERKDNKRNNYSAIKKILAGETKNYQLLCANCNWIKRYENNEHSKR
jgi:hypothetical protein